MLRQQQDVLPAVAQWRDREMNHPDPEEEVRAEAAFLYQGFQLAMRRGDYPDIDGLVTKAAEAPDGPILEQAQELDLSVRYWEGAVLAEGRLNAAPVTGQGYLELAGY